MKKHLFLTAFASTSLLLPAYSAGAGEPYNAVGQMLDQYVAIQESLAADSLKHVAQHATAIAKSAAENKVHGLPQAVGGDATALAKAKDIKAVRERFKKLSASFETFLKDHPDETRTYHVAYCPMAKAVWIQSGDTIANPYYGKAMLKCGTFKK